ncbi:hypothetical protein ACPZ19_06825 [Amycolatopsis lurida]
MTVTLQRRLTLVAALGMAYWFFGNLYEAVVFSPNWVVDSPAQFTRLREFFVNTGPTLYFVPVAQLAVLLVWVLWWRNRDEELKRDYRRAGVASLVSVALSVYVIAVLVRQMFGDEAPGPELTGVAWQWNAGNVIRMVLTAVTGWALFSAFRKLDRRAAS